MKKNIKFGVVTLFILFSLDCFSQDTLNAIDPIQIQEANEKWEKLKNAIELQNAVPPQGIINDTPHQPSQLDELIKSLHPVTDNSVNTNPATGPIAPSGVYNTSDTSNILIDEEVYNGVKNFEHKKNANESNLLIVVAIMGACILGLVGYIVLRK